MMENNVNDHKEIRLEGVDPRELYGPQDIYLEQIKALHPGLKIVARGSSLKVLGSKGETERFERRLTGLADYYLKYGHISKEVIAQAFSDGISSGDVPADKDVIVYGNNGATIRARTVNQQRLVKLYDDCDLLFAVGPAGSGKTYTAIALAVRALREKQVRRIILTRPAVEAGEKLGFLPGDMKEKLDPYLQPLYDALNDMIPAARLQKFMEEGTVQIAPLAYMRGRTLDNAFVILDGAEYDPRADQDVPHAHGPFGQIHRHGRRDADRPAPQGRQRPDAGDGGAASGRGDRHCGVRPARHRAPSAGQTDRRSLRPRGGPGKIKMK